MNKFLLFIVVFLPQIVTAQWEVAAEDVISNTPIGHRVWSIKMVDENTIWAVSAPDTFQPDSTHISSVYRSIDGGDTYEISTISETAGASLIDISAIDDQTAFVAGGVNGIQKTSDGGQSWNKLDTYPLPFVAIVHAFSENEILAVGGDGAVGFAVSNDGGLTWTLIGGSDWVTPPGTSLWELDPETSVIWTVFSNNATYDVVGDAMILGNNKGQFIKSTDKGYNWAIFDTPFTENGISSSCISMVNTDTFMMVSNINTDFMGIAPTSIATIDGGITWFNGFPPVTPADVQDFPNQPGTFIVASHANFSGAVGTAITYNFGESWQLIDNNPIITMDFLNDSVGVATCCNIPPLNAFGEIYRWNFDFPVSVIELTKSEITMEIGPNPFVNELKFKTNATENLEIVITDISGKTWQQFQTNGAAEFSKNVGDLPNGMYLVRVFDGQNWFTDKVVKQ